MTARIAVVLALFAAACGASDDGTTANAVALDGGVLLTPGAGTSSSSCQDDDGYLPDCAAVNGPAERGCDGATCARIVRSLKSRLASNAVDCMKQRIAAGDSCRACSAAALANSCPDPVSENACTQLRAKCPGRTFDDCLAIIGGLTFGGRLELIACTTDNDCAKDLAACLP